MVQSKVLKPTVETLRMHNRTVTELRKTSSTGITYTNELNWHKCIVVAVGDAAHANAEVYLSDWDAVEPYRSQAGKLIFLANEDALTSEDLIVACIAYSSTIIKRVVRSTIQAEAYNIQNVVEEADMVRAAHVDCRGLLDRKAWERSSADQMQMLWISDCNSLVTALSKAIVRTADKRLGLELASLRQQLWRYQGRTALDARIQEGAPPLSTRSDVLKWVDTHVMAADCLTKIMKDTFLQRILNTGRWCISQPEIGRAQKEQKQQYRAAKRAAKTAGNDHDVPHGSETDGQGDNPEE